MVLAVVAVVAGTGGWWWSGRERGSSRAAAPVVALEAAAPAPPPSLPPPAATGTLAERIDISGDDAFREQVGGALELLRERDPDAYAIVERYVGRIRQSPRSGMNVFAQPPTFELSDTSAFYSRTWCAGIIAHDSLHAKQFFDAAAVHGMTGVPAEAWSGKDSEKSCNAHQLSVLRNIGAPGSEIDYLSKLDGSHADVDGDGDYDAEDYRLRDW